MKSESLNQNLEQELPSWKMLILSTIYPLAVVIIELVTQICASMFFDPIPTIFHTLLILLVPLTNGLLWFSLRYKPVVSTKLLLILSSASLAISGYYALIFLPLVPLGLIGILLYGMGLLILGPLVSFIYAKRLRTALLEAIATGQYQDKPTAEQFKWTGLKIALLCLIILDIPATSTFLGLKWAASDDLQTQNRGLTMLRYLGNEDILLNLSYVNSRRSTGIISALVVLTDSSEHVPTSRYRQIFYQVTGTPFNQHPLPHTRRDWRRIDDARGSSEIGKKAKGLSLIASRIDGSINADEGVAYHEWSMTFQNNHSRHQEARMQIALPPGSVVSRATLWVNDEPQEAAFGKRAQVRAAYERVVRTNRDPLLVTTIGADRILAQAFPIPHSGRTLKFRLGITTPLELTSLDSTMMIMPTLIAHNFDIKDNFEHQLWIESKKPIDLQIINDDKQIESINTTNTSEGDYRIQSDISNELWTNPAKVITAKRDASVTESIARYRDFQTIKQTITKTSTEQTAKPISALMMLIDGSNGLKNSQQGLISTIKQLSEDANIGLIIANNPLIKVDAAKASQSHKQQLIDAIKSHDFVGGQDNTPAIKQAILDLENTPNAQILWLHAPQPILFEGSSEQLAQINDRVQNIAKISLYSVLPGPNKIVEHSKLTALSQAAHIAPIHGIEEDLTGYLNDLFNPQAKLIFKKERAQLTDIKATPTGSDHIARLWAFERINQAITEQTPQGPAMNMAINYQLVTQLSGAVVLENAQQYKDNDLTPVDANTVPTIPEPHQWMLAIILLLMMLWFLKHNKLNLTKSM